MPNTEHTGLNQSGLSNEYGDDVINAVNNQWEELKNVPMQKTEQPAPVQEQPVNHEQRNSANRITAKSVLKPVVLGLLMTTMAAAGIKFTMHQDRLVNEELKDSNNFKNTTEAVQDQERANAIENAEDDFDNYNIELPQ